MVLNGMPFRAVAAVCAALAGAPALAQSGVMESVSAVTGTVRAVTPIQRAALSRALDERAVGGAEIEAFYEARNLRPFWAGEDRRWAAALLSTLDRAGTHGLPVARYAPDALRALLASGDAARAEAAFMKAYLDFAIDISDGVVAPRAADRSIHIDVEPTPVDDLLRRLSGTPPADLFGLAPPAADYDLLVAELARLRDADDIATTLPRVPAGRSMRVGYVSDRVIALRERLAGLNASDVAREGTSLIAAATTPVEILPEGDARVYDETLAEAVRDYQRRNGLVDDGIVGPATLGRLNATLSDRQGQVLVNLERIRWLHRDPEERHILVNQADFSMEFMDGGRLLLDSRVIVGKRRHATPEFIDDMDHMVVNPTWHVPVSIATTEILPQLQRDPSYLERRGMRLVPVGGEPVPDGVTSDFSQYSRGYFPFRVKQRPSNSNALGRVKFMFPNQFSIYLHDTPTKRLFDRDQRTFSHGCVRVQRPFDLAYALLEGQEDDPRGYFDDLLARGTERRINLDRPVRVYLTYRTVFVDRAGKVQYRPDVYGRDESVLGALANAGVDTGI